MNENSCLYAKIWWQLLYESIQITLILVIGVPEGLLQSRVQIKRQLTVLIYSIEDFHLLGKRCLRLVLRIDHLPDDRYAIRNQDGISNHDENLHHLLSGIRGKSRARTHGNGLVRCTAVLTEH